ncbi:hypothetical protein L9G74_21225, partial [Shewanella sp. C32]
MTTAALFSVGTSHGLLLSRLLAYSLFVFIYSRSRTGTKMLEDQAAKQHFANFSISMLLDTRAHLFTG